MPVEEINRLAIQAKDSQEAFSILLTEVDPICRKVAQRYKTWTIDYQDILQLAHIEVWNAVKRFEYGKSDFVAYCKMTVVGHVKAHIHRLYNRTSFLNSMYRLDGTIEDANGYEWAVLTAIEVKTEKKPSSAETMITQKDLTNEFYEAIRQMKLTELERACLEFYFFDERSYKEIADKLGLSNKKVVDNALQRIRNKIAKNKRLYDIYKMSQELSVG